MSSSIPPGLIAMIAAMVLIGCATAWINPPSGSRAARALLWIEEGFGQILMVGMLLTAALQVAARYLFADHVTLPWTEEFSRVLLIWAALWGAAMVQRGDDHIAMTVLYDFMPPSAQAIFRVIGDLVALAVLAPVCWYGWETAMTLLDMRTASLGVPISVFILPVPVSATLMLVYSAYLLAKRLRKGPTASETPFTPV